MNWFKNNKVDTIIKKIKEILKNHPFTINISKYYHIPLSDIDENLEIEIVDLNGKFSEGNGKIIRLDPKILERDFFNKNFHFIIHEFFHWVKRRSEELFYFNDPEEIQSFVLQLTWLLISGKSENEAINEIYPIIKTHYKSDDKLNKVFKDMMRKALELYNIYQKSEKISI